MTLSSVLWGTTLLFPVSEVALAVSRRARGGGSATLQDRGSMAMLWIVILASVTSAHLVARWPAGRIPWPRPAIEAVALVVLASGIVFRWIAIVTLGRFFTVNVAVHEEQRIVEAGPYRTIRHPSYTGLLVAFAGLALAFGSWAGVLVMLVPIFLAVRTRIGVEERALERAFGGEYEAYRKRTSRLVPGIY